MTFTPSLDKEQYVKLEWVTNVTIWPWKRDAATAQPLLSQAEAIERAQIYAKAKGMLFEKPFDVYVQRQSHPVDTASGSQKRHVYVIRSIRFRPMSIVEIDAVDGTVLESQTFPR